MPMTVPYVIEPVSDPLLGLELARRLADLERKARPWGPWLDRLDASGVPLNAGDDDDDSDDDDDQDDDSDDDPPKKKKGAKSGSDDDDSDDDDDDGGDLASARKAAAAANRELRKLKAKSAKDSAQALKDAGKFKELYEEAQARLEKLEADVETATKSRLVEAELAAAGVKNPSRKVRLIDLDDIEDAGDAERAVKKLRKEEPDLFPSKTRQKRGAAGKTDDTDDDDDTPNTPKQPVNRLRRGLAAAGKASG